MTVVTLGPDGKPLRTKEVDASKLTSDCWPVQFNGLESCAICPYRDTDECGGGETLKRLKAEAAAKAQPEKKD